MRSICLVSVFVTLLFASFAYGQNQPRGQQPPPPAKAGPYKTVSVTPPHAINDATFETFRKQMNEAAQRKDRGALAKLVVGQGFFWLRENGDRADKSKSGVDNLSAALGLNNKDGAGWDMLASFADDPTGSPLPERNGALCAPADPTFDGKAFNDLMQATQTDVGDWAYPVTHDVEVRALPQPNAPVIEKPGMVLLRAMPEDGANIPTFLRIVTPAGKIGYVLVDSVAPIGNDQLCYVKDSGGWKIGGYIGGGDTQ
jgi:hypothetical protein